MIAWEDESVTIFRNERYDPEGPINAVATAIVYGSVRSDIPMVQITNALGDKSHEIEFFDRDSWDAFIQTVNEMDQCIRECGGVWRVKGD